jgi:flavin reductase (DIM6/NTAB) family NADH-FMN oxidoreductase RutF
MKKEINPTTAVVPCPVVLLSVAGKERPNIITLSWVANVCSKPPTVVVGIRPQRYSYEMVKAAGDFVLNIPSTSEFEAADFAGTKSGREHDKFSECNLTPRASTVVSSPMIEECPINLECKVKSVDNIGAHDLFTAEIVAVHIDDSMLDERGRFDSSKMKMFSYVPLSGEYRILGEKLGNL